MLHSADGLVNVAFQLLRVCVFTKRIKAGSVVQEKWEGRDVVTRKTDNQVKTIAVCLSCAEYSEKSATHSEGHERSPSRFSTFLPQSSATMDRARNSLSLASVSLSLCSSVNPAWSIWSVNSLKILYISVK